MARFLLESNRKFARSFDVKSRRAVRKLGSDGHVANEPVAGVPHLLFQTHIIGSRIVLFQYAVSADGKRFLINSTPSIGAAPLTVLMN
jgi:hypothetical protein